MTPQILVGLLAESTRMRVFAAVVLGAATPAKIAECANITLRDCVAALRRLRDGGLIDGPDTALRARIELWKEVAKEQGQAPPAEPLDPDSARASVLRTFIVDGRLVSFPATRAKRRGILEHPFP